MGFTHPVGDKRAEDFALVLFRNRFDAGKRRSRAGHGFPGETFQPGIDRKISGSKRQAAFLCFCRPVTRTGRNTAAAPQLPQNEKPSRS